jgi:hypothetical protein
MDIYGYTNRENRSDLATLTDGCSPRGAHLREASLIDEVDEHINRHEAQGKEADLSALANYDASPSDMEDALTHFRGVNRAARYKEAAAGK